MGVEMILLDVFFVSTLLITAFVYLLYPVILLIIGSVYPSSRRSGENPDPLPKISVIVPTYNEGLVIKSKLESLLQTSYPKDRCEIIVVDSGSTDNTRDIAGEFGDKIMLLRQEKRLGKANAINFALREAKGEIIFLSDANSKFQPGLLSEIVKKFDRDTGAVLPRLIPSGKLSLWDKAFYEIHHIYKSLESRSDSVFIVFGELFAFRKALVSRIDDNVASDDLEIAFTVRRKNYKVKYAPDLNVAEKIPSSAEETSTQRTRRAFGIIQVMKKNNDLLFNPKYGSYGMVIFPTHFVQMTVQPFLVFCLLISLVMKIVVLLLFANQMVIVPLLLLAIFAVFLLAFTKLREIVLFGYNFLLTQLNIILALFDLVRGKSYRVWKKAGSTRTEL